MRQSNAIRWSSGVSHATVPPRLFSLGLLRKLGSGRPFMFELKRDGFAASPPLLGGLSLRRGSVRLFSALLVTTSAASPARLLIGEYGYPDERYLAGVPAGARFVVRAGGAANLAAPAHNPRSA